MASKSNTSSGSGRKVSPTPGPHHHGQTPVKPGGGSSGMKGRYVAPMAPKPGGITGKSNKSC